MSESRRRRRWLVVGSVALAVAGLGGGALWVFASSADHWNGWSISITNECGYDLYADDGDDGVPILAGQSISWDRASRSGDKTIRLWRSASGQVAVGEGLVVSLHGDSVLAGPRCP